MWDNNRNEQYVNTEKFSNIIYEFIKNNNEGMPQYINKPYILNKNDCLKNNTNLKKYKMNGEINNDEYLNDNKNDKNIKKRIKKNHNFTPNKKNK